MGRTPRNYAGIQSPGKSLSALLPEALRRIGDNYGDRPDLILLAWPKIIGEKLAPMTHAVSFDAGVLTVKVDNSTLYSLLSQHEKAKLLERLRAQFPKITIRNIIFRIGT
jgi:hypothetical protein